MLGRERPLRRRRGLERGDAPDEGEAIRPAGGPDAPRHHAVGGDHVPGEVSVMISGLTVSTSSSIRCVTSISGSASSRWSGKWSKRSELKPITSPARLPHSCRVSTRVLVPLAAPSARTQACTWSPTEACRARVAPAPRISSSGCAAMTITCTVSCLSFGASRAAPGNRSRSLRAGAHGPRPSLGRRVQRVEDAARLQTFPGEPVGSGLRR